MVRALNMKKALISVFITITLVGCRSIASAAIGVDTTPEW